MERPSSAFEKVPDLILPIVEGVDLHHSNSFPSGHASTFFVFFTCLALLVAYFYQQKHKDSPNKSMLLMYLTMIVLLMMAALGAYSRVYLSQHFVQDITVGSIAGFFVPCILFHFGKNKIFKNNSNPEIDTSK